MGAPALVAAQGEHLGLAIAAAEAHITGSHAIAVEVAAGDDVPLGESVGKHHIVELGAATDTPSLRWPIGILPALGHTGPLATARRGWIEHAAPRGGRVTSTLWQPRSSDAQEIARSPAVRAASNDCRRVA